MLANRDKKHYLPTKMTLPHLLHWTEVTGMEITKVNRKHLTVIAGRDTIFANRWTKHYFVFECPQIQMVS